MEWPLPVPEGWLEMGAAGHFSAGEMIRKVASCQEEDVTTIPPLLSMFVVQLSFALTLSVLTFYDEE